MKINDFYRSLSVAAMTQGSAFQISGKDDAKQLTLTGLDGTPRTLAVPKASPSTSEDMLVREALCQAIEQDLGQKALAKVKTLLLGSSGKAPDVKLTPLEARKIIDLARTADEGNVTRLIDSSLLVTKFSDDVKALIIKTIGAQASNPVVADFLVKGVGNLNGLMRLAALTAAAHANDADLTEKERLACAYLRGFGRSVANEVDLSDTRGARASAFRSEAESAHEKSGVHDANAESAHAQRIQKAYDKVPELKTGPDVFKKQITDLAAGDLKDFAFPEGDAEAKKEPDPIELTIGKDKKKFVKTTNSGKNDNCFLFAALTQMGLSPTSQHAQIMRGLFHKEVLRLDTLAKDVKVPYLTYSHTKPSEKGTKSSVPMDAYGLIPEGAQSENATVYLDQLFSYHLKENRNNPFASKKFDVTHGALLARALQQPVTILKIDTQKQPANVAEAVTFDVDVGTGRKLTGKPIYLGFTYDSKTLDSGHFEALDLIP